MTSQPVQRPVGSLHERVARDYRTQIEAGHLRDAEALPSTRDMAEACGVSTFTITTAMNTLAAEGLIETSSRSRRIVRYSRPPEAANPPPLAPHTLLIGGYAGSGKTELGRILTGLTGWMIIDKDTITRPVVEEALQTLGQPAHDRDSDVYLNRIRPREYEALMATAHENTACGVGAIITAPFLDEFRDQAWIERQRSQFALEGSPLTLVWVTCDADSMRTYLRRRGAARDMTKLDAWDTYLEGIDLAFRPMTDHILIDNSASAEPLRAQAQRLANTLANAAVA